jgi:crossover junction endodeoxyribonuclease RuvC
MTILGIDPGIGRMGWGIIVADKGKFRPVDYGCLETSPKRSTPERLEEVYATMIQLCEQYNIDALSIEELFFNTNAKTAFVVGQARGVVLLAASQKKIPISIYTPLQVKMALTGYGRADKSQVEQMVKLLLKLEKIPKPDDTSDALAIALTHAFSHKMKDRSS